jgi:hypothetical protein
MIGILFHGPEVFDSGWARRIVQSFSTTGPLHCVLAGTMGRTAAIDSGLPDIPFPGMQPSQILKELQAEAGQLIFANYDKSPASGLLHGAMVGAKANVRIPLVQIECSAGLFVELNAGSSPEVIEILERQLGLQRHDPVENVSSIREQKGRICRRLTAAAAGDFVLAHGIVMGRAIGGEIVIECEGRHIIKTSGIEIKTHGLEKLDGCGGIDLESVKLATTSTLRRMEHTPRIVKQSGKGMAFVDHAAIRVYEQVRNVEGAVTVGDDTTAIVGDLLYRFGMPVIGITDGDRDVILGQAASQGASPLEIPARPIRGLNSRRSPARGDSRSQKLSLLNSQLSGQAFHASRLSDLKACPQIS